MSGWIHELIQFTNPQHLIEIGGLTALLAVVFIESGLFFGFFLPGDSLLFIAGLLCSHPDHKVLQVNVVVLMLLLLAACTLGSLAGYLFGFRVGEYLDEKRDTFFFKKKHLRLTRSFYDKHEHMAFVLGRFLPIIRTFVPILAGIIKLPFGRFMFLNVMGCVCWVSVMVMAGYFSGLIFPGLIHYLQYVVIFLVIVTMIPVVRTYFREKRELEMLAATEQE